MDINDKRKVQFNLEYRINILMTIIIPVITIYYKRFTEYSITD